MKFILFINVKIPVVGILTFISRINDCLWGCFTPKISIDFGYFYINEQIKFHAQQI